MHSWLRDKCYGFCRAVMKRKYQETGKTILLQYKKETVEVTGNKRHMGDNWGCGSIPRMCRARKPFPLDCLKFETTTYL
jgi:hypothetical protein